MSENTGVYFVAGNDEYLVYQKSLSLYNQYGKDIQDDMAKEVLDAKVGTLGDLEVLLKALREAIEIPSLFCPQKILWLKNVNFLGAHAKLSQSEACKKLLESFQDIVASINPNSTKLIISASPIDARTKTIKWFQKTHTTHILKDEDNTQALESFIKSECTSLNIAFNDDAKETLSKKIIGSQRLLHEEVRKLATFAHKQHSRITQTMVFELVPDFGEGDFFEPVEAFFANDVTWVSDSLRRYFFIHKEARPLISALQNRNRLLIQLMALNTQNSITHIDPQLFTSLKNNYQKTYGFFDTKSSYNLFTQNVWYIKRLLNEGKRFSLSKSIEHQKTFLSCFKAILENPQNQETVVHQLLLKNLCSTL